MTLFVKDGDEWIIVLGGLLTRFQPSANDRARYREINTF